MDTGWLTSRLVGCFHTGKAAEIQYDFGIRSI